MYKLTTPAKQHLFIVGDEEGIVNHARLLIRTNLETGISPQDMAEQLKISYSRFRKLTPPNLLRK